MELDQINTTEAKNILRYIISNNVALRKENKKPTAVEINGESGLGKTSVIAQLAKELGMDFVMLNLAQIEELGD